MKHLVGQVFLRAFGAFLHASLTILVLLSAARALADAPPPLAVIRATGTNFEGRQSYRLEWEAAPGTWYRLEARTGFESNTMWQPLDVVPTMATAGVYSVSADQATADAAPQQFFRVLAPQPEISGIEPALLGTNGGEMFLIGQCFGSNITARIGGLVLTSSVVEPGRLFSFQVPGGSLAEGSYDLEVLDGTNIVARAANVISISAQVAVAAIKQRLLEPPTAPPADPSALKVKEKGNRTKGSSHLRVLPATGELQLQETDLWVPGRGLDFQWTRTYRSRTGRNTVMGQNWTHSYDIVCLQTNGGIAVQDGTGRIDLYVPDTNGLYTCNELFNVGTFSNGVFALAFPDGGKWIFNPITPGSAPGPIARIEDRFGNALTFTYDPNNRLLTVIDTLGRTNRVSYGGTGRISSVADFTGRVVLYSHWRAGEEGGGNGALRSVTTPPVTGTPNGNDFPQGKTTTFTYTKDFSDQRLNHNLLTITDPFGQTWLSVEYGATTNAGDVDFDRVASFRRGADGGPRTFLSYTPLVPALSNGFAVVKAIVNDPLGNVAVDWFDSLNRVLVHRDLAARAQPDTLVTETNLPTVKLRDTDPDFWETRYEWNADSLCTRVTFPRGNSTEFVFQRAFNQNSSRSNHARRSDGNPLVIRERACCGGADLDGDGDADLTELVWRLEFDPRFGSPASLCSAGMVDGLALRGHALAARALPPALFESHKAWDGIVSSGWFRKLNRKAEDAYEPWEISDPDEAVVSNPLYEQSGVSGVNPLFESSRFVVRATDARGNTDTATYNERGVPLVISHHGRLLDGSDKPVTNFEYDPAGQIAGIVYPDNGNKSRRRDEFLYAPDTGLLRQWTVDAQGPTVSIVRFEHDARGNVTAEVDGRGNTNRFVFNALDQVVQELPAPICSPCGPYLTEYFYDANDNVVRVERNNVDGAGLLDTNNPTWTALYGYDVLNRRTLEAHEIVHTPQQRFATNRFTYDANDNVIEAFSPEAVNGHQPGNLVTFDYDTRSFLWRQTRGPSTPEQSTDEFEYDGNGNLMRATYGRGGGDSGTVYRRNHDGFDRPAIDVDPMGNVTFYAYDASHNLVGERRDGDTNDVGIGKSNRRLAETRYEYDSLDRLARRRAAFFDVFTELPLLDGESTTAWSYAQNGAVRSVTDDNGNTTSYSYDSRGRLASVTDAKANLRSYTYDANGNVLSVTQSDSSDVLPTRPTFLTTYAYDAWNRCVLDFDNVGNTNRYAYDSRNNRTHHLDARGNLQRWQYDGLDRAIVIEADLDGDGEFEPLDIARRQVWDDNSRLVEVIDDNTNTTRFLYDALDRQTLVMHADNTEVRFTYDTRDNVKTNIDANGNVVLHSYDRLDRCVRKDVAPAIAMGVSAQTTFETYVYDGLSRMVQASNNVSMIEFSRDSLGNVAKAKQDCVAAAFVHDGVGNRTSMTYPAGRLTSWSYDALNRPTSVSTAPTSGVPASVLASIAYEGVRRVARVARANGINTRVNYDGDVKTTNAPGDFGWQQISRINHQDSGGGTTFDRRFYAYDRTQNKTARIPGSAFLPAAALRTNQWGYDAAHRMQVSAISRGGTISSQSLRLDGNGNREQVIKDGAVMNYTMDATTPEPADFQMNQYSVTPFDTRQYDHNGNLVYIPGPAGGVQFTYDYANRLVSVAREVGPALSPIVSFTYDCFGRRLSKTTYPPAPAAPETTVFYYDGEDIVEERDSTGATRKAVVFPHALEVSGRVFFTNGGETQYLLTDEMGNALVLTDGGGNIIERYEYDDFGAPEFLTSDGAPIVGGDGQPVRSSPAGNPFLFHGMFWDGETQLYFGHSQGANVGPMQRRWDTDPYSEDVLRHFDPRVGQYLTRASHGVWPGTPAEMRQVLKTFAGNNPWTHDAGGRGGSGGGDATWRGQDVYVWKLKKEEGGRHTPFHNKYVAEVSDFGMSRMTAQVQEPLVHTYRWRSAQSKSDVYVWKLKKEEGGRHTPFHNKSSAKVSDFGLSRLLGHELTHVAQHGIRGHRDVGGYRARHETAMNSIRNMK